MIVLEAIVVLFVILYVHQNFMFLRAFLRPRRAPSPGALVRATVLVAARNEEKDIGRCIESLVAQDYPKDLLEIIIIDDRSTDRTGEICRQYVAKHSFLKLLVAPDTSELRGKANALDHGVSQATGEIILLTDADCEAPPTWVKRTVEQYGPEVGIVGGMTIPRSRGIFAGIQSLEWAYLLGIASAGVNRRLPLSVIGNNLSFRKAAYESIGGYRALKFSVTEDFRLFRGVLDSKQWDYLFPVDHDRIVSTEPCETWGDLIRQKHRWGTGGLDMWLHGFYVMALGFAMPLSALLALIMGGVAAGGTGLVIKFLADYLFLHAVLTKIHRKDLFRYFYVFELYYTLSIVIIPFLVFFGGKVSWKGRKY